MLQNFEQSGVYLIRHAESGRIYVGSTRNFGKRWRQHVKLAKAGKHYSRNLQRDWDQSGQSGFEMSPVFLCSPEELFAYEQVFIDSLKPAYNTCPTAGSMLGTHWNVSDETRKRQSAYHSNRPAQHHENLCLAAALTQTVEKRAKLSAYALNRSEDHKQKLTIANSSEDKRKRMSASNTGQKRTEETRLRMSAAQKIAMSDPERRAKISARQKGRKKPEATVKAMKDNSRARSALTIDDIREIRNQSAAGRSNVELGMIFGVHRRTISDIIRRKTWVDVQ